MSGRAIALVALLAGGACLATGYWLGRPAPVIETPAAEVVQDDGSRIVERAPNKDVKPKQKVPKGAKVERVMTVEVQGAGLKMADGKYETCPPVTVDLSLVRERDGMKRVLASSPNGEIVKAIDIPVETAAPPPEPNLWAVGLSWSPTHQTPGVWIERDLIRVRVGVEINQTRQQAFGPVGAEARVRVGWVF